MNESRRSSFELDLALLQPGEPQDWSEADRARLAQRRAADRAFLLRHPRRPIFAMPRPRTLAKWTTPFLAAAAVIGLAVMTQVPEAPQVRAKGAEVTMFVKRGPEVEPFRGDPLSAGDTLVFRYSTTRRHLALAGVEESGRATVYANRPIEPGTAWLSTGIKLDDYLGPELVVAVFSDEPIGDAQISAALAKLGPVSAVRLDSDRRILGVPGEQSAWRILKRAPQ